jgi:hypothetical protein
MTLNDVHCHFFSNRFFAALGRGLKDSNPSAPEARALEILAWDPPGIPEQLADRWVAALDANSVSRAAIISSIPGDAESVAAAVRRHPKRFVGFFMVDPTRSDAAPATAAALDRCVHSFATDASSQAVPLALQGDAELLRPHRGLQYAFPSAIERHIYLLAHLPKRRPAHVILLKA